MASKIIFAISIIILGLTGCAASLYMPTENDANALNTNLETLMNYKKLYVKKCGSCHALHLPSEYNSKQWAATLDKMQERAKIDYSEKEKINTYLQLNANIP
jgi:nitrate/TMAO reductase-like tetraheme cytochrome c subunit